MAAIVVNCDTLTLEALDPIRSGVFAGELLTVEVVALVSAITKWLVLRSSTAAEGIRGRSLDPDSSVIEDRHPSFHPVWTAGQYTNFLLVRRVRRFLLLVQAV